MLIVCFPPAWAADHRSAKPAPPYNDNVEKICLTILQPSICSLDALTADTPARRSSVVSYHFFVVFKTGICTDEFFAPY
jgi:hypothetical protein